MCMCGWMQQDCNDTNETTQQPSRRASLAQRMANTVHRRHQTSYNGNMSTRHCSSLQRPESSDDDNDVGSPPHETVSDVGSKPEQPAENYDSSQSTSQGRSETSKRGARGKVKRRRKSEAPSKANSELTVDTTPVAAQDGSGKQKTLRLKVRKRKKGDHVVEKSDLDAAESCESDKQTGSANDDVVHTCEDCGKEFPSANVLTRHKRTHSSRIFHCKECSTDFAEPVTFKRHSVVIHEIHRPFTCSHAGCNYRSDRLSNVEKHMSIHSPTHAFACSLCGRTFAQDAGLRSHLLSCMSSRTFLCDLCGSAFNHLQSMQSHQRVHTGERPYRCTDCDSTFADHRNYKRHRRIHDNAFPYACMLCGKRFRHSNSLKSHLGSHGIMTKPVEGLPTTPPHTSQTGAVGILSKPVESTSATPTHPSHGLAHTAF